jgi:hypothetical protein
MVLKPCKTLTLWFQNHEKHVYYGFKTNTNIKINKIIVSNQMNIVLSLPHLLMTTVYVSPFNE